VLGGEGRFTLLDVLDVAGGEGDADSVDLGCCLGLFGVLFGGAFSDCMSGRFLMSVSYRSSS
jgi:hypothetical protein